jgi:rubrerythrin
MKKEQVEELLYQALETELGGVQVYRSAVACAQNEDLKEEWQKYGKQTQEHVRVLRGVFDALGLDPERQTPGRRIVRDKGQSLVAAMEKAMRDGSLAAAQLVAAECVVDAETKDHMNWQLIGEVAKKAPASAKKALTEAYDAVEDEEDEHLYHTKGWTRELWLDSLGLQAELPPPEEEKDVKSAMEEAKVAQERKGKESPAKPAASRRSVPRPSDGKGRQRQKSV